MLVLGGKLQSECVSYALVNRPCPIMLVSLPTMLFLNSPVLPLLCFQPVVPIMLKLCPILVVKVSAITSDYIAT